METILSCITQIITTLITIGVTILVAYRTYRSQKIKEDAKTERFQSINCRSSLELFNAYIANLLPFVSPEKTIFETKNLQFCIQKMKLTEQYLSELTEADLPDTFIEEFRYYRIKLAFQRISLENRLSFAEGENISSSCFDDLETLSLISSVERFVSSYSPEKTEG